MNTVNSAVCTGGFLSSLTADHQMAVLVTVVISYSSLDIHLQLPAAFFAIGNLDLQISEGSVCYVNP